MQRSHRPVLVQVLESSDAPHLSNYHVRAVDDSILVHHDKAYLDESELAEGKKQLIQRSSSRDISVDSASMVPKMIKDRSSVCFLPICCLG